MLTLLDAKRGNDFCVEDRGKSYTTCTSARNHALGEGAIRTAMAASVPAPQERTPATFSQLLFIQLRTEYIAIDFFEMLDSFSMHIMLQR